MSRCIMNFIKNHPTINSITMKFSVPGHSCIQEIDNIHSQIEKVLRHKEYYSPVGLIPLIKNCNRKNPFKIIEMEENDFKAFSSIGKNLLFKKIPYSKVFELRFTQSIFDLEYKIAYSDNFQLINLKPEKNLRKRKCILSNPEYLVDPSVEKKKYVVSKEKKMDLQSMMKFLPPGDRAFYQKVLN